MADQLLSANPGYAADQRARAHRTLAEHPDPQTRARAAAKIARWEAVLEGMASGALEIGSRVPVHGAPAWATLEVSHGGFATGRLCAAGTEEPFHLHRGSSRCGTACDS